MAEVPSVFAFALPRILELFRPFFDFNMLFARVLRRSVPLVCVFDLHSIHDPPTELLCVDKPLMHKCPPAGGLPGEMGAGQPP